MIKASLMYPFVADARFDEHYYLRQHIPMVRSRLASALKRTVVERGILGASPGNPPPFMMLGHLYFESIEAMMEAYTPHAREILDDIPNFTDLEPVMMISEVVVD